MESGAWSGDPSVQPESAKTLPVALKVVVIVMMVLVGGIGAIVGLLGGIAMAERHLPPAPEKTAFRQPVADRRANLI